MSFFNPFSDIIETKASPHAHVLRTSFWEKCHATLVVCFGKFLSSEDHIGLFDYFTIFVPFLLSWLVDEISGSENPLIKFVAYPFLFLINVLLFLARALFAIVLTLASLPLIAVVHGLAWLIEGRNLKRNVGKLTLVRENSENELTLTGNLEDISKVKDIPAGCLLFSVIFEGKEYKLCLVSELPNDDLEVGKIYLAEDGSYCVGRGNEVVKGSLREENINLNNLVDNLKNGAFRDSIVQILFKRGDILGEPVVYLGFRKGRSLFFPLNPSTIDSMPLDDKPRFNEQVSAFKSLLLLNPYQITKGLEKDASSSPDSNADKVIKLYMCS